MEEINFYKTLAKLHELGWSPQEVLDIGCNRGNWTRSLKQLYEVPVYMIDPNNYEVIIANTKYIQACLSNKEEEIDWFGQETTGDSIYKEITSHFDLVQPKKIMTQTIDGLLNKGLLSQNINFIKMDCQGAELKILEGASNLLPNIGIILSEMPFMGVFNEGAPKFIEYINYMDKIGFIPYDIAELHKSRGLMTHVDLFFINKNLINVRDSVQNVIKNFGKDGL